MRSNTPEGTGRDHVKVTSVSRLDAEGQVGWRQMTTHRTALQAERKAGHDKGHQGDMKARAGALDLF